MRLYVVAKESIAAGVHSGIYFVAKPAWRRSVIGMPRGNPRVESFAQCDWEGGKLTLTRGKLRELEFFIFPEPEKVKYRPAVDHAQGMACSGKPPAQSSSVPSHVEGCSSETV
jgi:hypothetical protein